MYVGLLVLPLSRSLELLDPDLGALLPLSELDPQWSWLLIGISVGLYARMRDPGPGDPDGR